MDELRALDALGLTLPSPAYIVGAIAFGIIGIVAYRRGKRQQRPRTRWIGVALMLYPYLVSQTWLLYLLGVALTVAAWWESD
jgi:apolipoprotein N-acyltransferase